MWKWHPFFCGTAEQSGAALLPGPTAVVGERGDQTAGHEDQARACRPPTGSQEDGGMLPGSQLLRLEGSQVTVGTGCAESEGARCGAGSEGTQPILRQNLSLPVARLLNHCNYCYVHSCLQAVFWCGELTAQPDSCYGRLKAGLLLLKRPVKLQIPSCLSLRSVLAGWDNPRAQHDAGEYFRFLLAQLQPPAFIGQWQARLTLPFTIVDEGQLTTLVILLKAGRLPT